MSGNKSPYSKTKIAWHIDTLEQLRLGRPVAPIFVHWFPTNVCNQHCHFCSYGHWKNNEQGPPPSAWKNNQMFGEQATMPREKMLETVACLKRLGTKAVEVTGGGEPTAYPHFDEMIDTIARAGMEVALVSNGVLLTEARAKLVMHTAQASWARISLDAGSRDSYARVRSVPQVHFDKALQAVSYLVKYKRHPEALVGVGYVVDRDNYDTVYDGIRLAFEAGADNVRVSLAFTPELDKRLTPEQLQAAQQQAEAAKAKFTSATASFQVSNLLMERSNNTLQPVQAYPYCYWKDVACVIGADQRIYTCCSLAYNSRGFIGSIEGETTFEDFWNSKATRKWRRSHRPCYDCPVICLYEGRNKEALRLMLFPDEAALERLKEPPAHINYV